MTIDRAFIELNRRSTERMKVLAAALSDEEMRHPVGEHWNVGVVFAHLAFWDRRAMYVLDKTEQEGKVFFPEIDIVTNDLSLPLWAAIPPREAARIAIENAEKIDRRIETYPPVLLEELYAQYPRIVDRSRHRNEHLDEADAALKGSSG